MRRVETSREVAMTSRKFREVLKKVSEVLWPPSVRKFDGRRFDGPHGRGHLLGSLLLNLTSLSFELEIIWDLI